MFGFFKKKSKVSWEKSENGNSTATEGEWRITVFPKKNPKSFGFCLAERGEDGSDKRVIFSRRFRDEDDATDAAAEIFRAAINGDRALLKDLRKEYEED